MNDVGTNGAVHRTKPVRVLVLWANALSANLGVRVLAAGAQELARRAWGEETIVDFQDFGPDENGLPFAGKVVIRDLMQGNGPIRAKIRQYDVILDTGAGDSFADIYGLKRLGWMLNIHRVAHSERKPMVLTPQTIGPFKTSLGRIGARYALSKAELVQVRDRVSQERSASLGRAPEVLSTDLVFLLPQPVTDRSRDIILNVSGLLWNPNSHVNFEAYRAAVVRFAREALREGRRVTLLAHVMMNPSLDADPPAVLAAQELLNADVEIILPSDLEDARQVIASGQLLVGARMHACLNAISTGVATIPWAYSRKFRPLFEDIGWKTTVDLRTDDDPAESTLLLMRQQGEKLTDSARRIGQAARERLDPAVAALASMSLAGE